MTTKDKMLKILTQTFHPQYLEVIDESLLHQGHTEAVAGAGGHFVLKIISKDFAGKDLVNRHRMIYGALKEIRSEIHALAIHAMDK